MRFSIIIPVYNVEKYIRKCMESVMHQTFSDYEVIVVDDESPDNSIQIVQEYADAYPGKIHIFRQKNTRQGGARNHGVAKARGEYLLFVDSDDYVAPTMLETVDRRLTEQPCDILVFRHVLVTPEGALLSQPQYCALAPGYYTPETDRNVVQLPTGPTNKAFRRDFYLASQFSFPEKILYEDAVTRLLYAMAESIVVCEDVLYYYVQSSNSSMRQKISERMLDILTVSDIVIREFQSRNLYEAFQDPLECELIYGILYVLDPINQVQMDSPLQIPMADYLAVRFPAYRSNPYVGRTLCRAVELLSEHSFRKYHYRILWIGRLKEVLLRNPLLAWINEMRK